MRKTMTLAVLLTLMAVGLSMAADTPATPEAAAPTTTATAPAQGSCGPVDISKMTDVERNAWLKERGLQQVDQTQRTVPPPPCPALDTCGFHPTCTGSADCAQSSVTSNVDTGLTTCTDSSGGLTCTNGGTIHAVTYACHACPCCSLPPGQRCMCNNNCSVGHGYYCSDPE